MPNRSFTRQSKQRRIGTWVLLTAVVTLSLVLLISTPASRQKSSAQTPSPILVSEPTSTRAVALDSITHVHEPFSSTSDMNFGADNRTRVMLFAMNLTLAVGEDASAVSVTAEDGNGNQYTLPVEYVGAVPEQPWLTSIVVSLDPGMGDLGDVLVNVAYHSRSSNRVRVGIGHRGDGPPDDIGAVPTPGTTAQQASVPPNPPAGNITASDVQTIISQAVSTAQALNQKVTVAVVDREANVLGVFRMTGAPTTTLIRSVGANGKGLEGLTVPSELAAISKAGTGAIFSTSGNAFSTRTAGFIIQEHFPPAINLRGGGPLYGVQFSSLPCSDIKQPGLPLGLSADPGGLPLYKNGAPIGGVGIESDGLYTVDRDPTDLDQPVEEVVAAAAEKGFEPPDLIRGDNILVDGIRLVYRNVGAPPAVSAIPFSSLPGTLLPGFPIRSAQPTVFSPGVLGGVSGETDPRFFPVVAATVPAGPNALTASDVQTILTHAIQQANITRAAIRQPLGSNARVSVAVVSTDGKVLGLFRSSDAPVFGFDVSVQKARTATFYSGAGAGTLLRAAGFGNFVDRAKTDGLLLDGSVAFTDRAGGFLHRPFFPDGIDNTAAGPFSTSLSEWSPFNVGLQLELVKTNLLLALGGASVPCTSVAGIPNGIQIFPGSVPLYKNGTLVGGVGVSGDGVDQDDIISAAGANGYSPATSIRSDQVFVRGVRLPFLKFPRSPNL